MAKGQGGVPLPSIGKHLAVCNLFREADGTVQITVASAIGGLGEYNSGASPNDRTPNDYVERLIVEAARNIIERRPGLKPEASDLAIAIGEHAFRAGFEDGAVWGEKRCGYLPSAANVAWSAYDPPEDLKGREFL